MSQRRSEHQPNSLLTQQQTFAKINIDMATNPEGQPQTTPEAPAPKKTVEQIARQADRPIPFLARFGFRANTLRELKDMAAANELAKAKHAELEGQGKIGADGTILDRRALELRAARFADAQKRVDVQLNAVGLESLSAPMQELVRTAVDAYALQAEQQVQALMKRAENPLSDADAQAEVKKNNHVIVEGNKVTYVRGEHVTYKDGKLQLTPGQENVTDDITKEVVYQMQADQKTALTDKYNNKVPKKRPGKSTSTVQVMIYEDEVQASGKTAKKDAQVIVLTATGREKRTINETTKLASVVRDVSARPAEITYTPALGLRNEVNRVSINSTAGIDDARYFDTMAYVARHPDLKRPVTIVSGETKMVFPSTEGVLNVANVTEEWQIGEFKEVDAAEVVPGRIALTTEQAALLGGLSSEKQQQFLIEQTGLISKDNNFTEHPIDLKPYDTEIGQTPDTSANKLSDAATIILEARIEAQANRIIVINEGEIPRKTLNTAEMAMIIGAGVKTTADGTARTVEAANAFNASVIRQVAERKKQPGNEIKSDRKLAQEIINETLIANYPDNAAEDYPRRQKAGRDLVRELYPLTDAEALTEALAGVDLSKAITIGAKIGLEAEKVTTLFNSEHLTAGMDVKAIQGIASRMLAGEIVQPEDIETAQRALELTAESKDLTATQKAALARILGPRQLTATEIFDRVATAIKSGNITQNADSLRTEIAQALERTDLAGEDRDILTRAQEQLPKVEETPNPEAVYGQRIQSILSAPTRTEAMRYLSTIAMTDAERTQLINAVDKIHPESNVPTTEQVLVNMTAGGANRGEALQYLMRQNGLDLTEANAYLDKRNLFPNTPPVAPAQPQA